MFSRHMEATIRIAEANPTDLPKMAAAIYDRNKLIAVGLNSRKTDPMQARFGKNPEATCIHAEISAIKNALRHVSVDELKRMKIVVARVKKDMSPAGSKPCSGCAGALAVFGINTVEYIEQES